MKQDQTATPSKLIHNAFITAIGLFFATVFILLWDNSFNNDYLFNRTVYGTDCNYQVPAGYSIYYSTDHKRYAVKVLQFDNYYLYNGRWGITTMFSTISEPSLFKD